ncbi:MAG: hypothetical protein ACREKN_07605 [Longimicrobiaceae bacterium]
MKTLVCSAVSAFVLAGCASEGGDELPGSYATLHTLVEAVLDELAEGDTAGLARLRVTRDEYEALLWDELPESEEIPFAFSWDLNQANSRKALKTILGRYGGERFVLVNINFTKRTERYQTFTLYRGARLRVRRGRGNVLGELPILDVVLERKGRWKLVNYEEP